MRTLVESLKRLYDAGKVTLEKLEAMLTNKTISIEEFEYITLGV